MNQRIVDINPAANVLIDKLTELGRPEVAGYNAERKTHTLKEVEFYYRRKISGEAGSTPFKTSKQKAEDGLTDIQNGILGMDVLITGIRVGIAKNAAEILATAASLAAQDYAQEIYDFTDVTADATDQNANEALVQSAAVFAKRIADAITNSRLAVKVGDTIAFEKSTGSFLRRNVTSNELVGANAHLELSIPKFVAADEVVEFIMDFLGTSVGNYYAVEITLMGLTLVPNNLAGK